jgi:hypothetical protein
MKRLHQALAPELEVNRRAASQTPAIEWQDLHLDRRVGETPRFLYIATFPDE